MPTARGRALGELRRACWYTWSAHGDVLCVWCKRPLTFDTMTIEHLIPKALGGTDAIDTLAPACRPCNSSRGKRRTPKRIPPASDGTHRSRHW